MCNITILPPGSTIPYPKIQNVVWNNPHGWGGVLKDNGRLEVRKFFNEKGTDPEEVARWLDENKDIERIFHVRWQTEGAINKENVQPFDCYYTDKIHIVGAHNGTLYDYKGQDSRSDSRRFFEDLASPLITRFGGDIEDKLFQEIINKFFGSAVHNKGILINSAGNHVLLNAKEWQKLKVENEEFVTSNLDYFNELKRGYVFEQRKKEAAERGSMFQKRDEKEIAKVTDINFGYRHDLKVDIGTILSEVTADNTEGIVALSNLKHEEVSKLVKEKGDVAITLFMYLTTELRRCFDAYNSIEEKHEKATKMIAELKNG
jgi:predicted glutamine amidotransferase